ncbi:MULTISPECIES: SH3 domain-containing protein [Eikenella]|uniref:SH3 domain-containing protein n=1 Tax=Eikenella exigua TaxID=2528037 RepID=A0AAX1F7U3_9NEIS|nr:MULTISPECIES: SH3 domain-containing protein [Eikenella]OAM28606.1 hypothetical protein A7P94_00830 [Eikenella sp. NML01-A-086]OAM41266.1 hypothetical protein A7Q02_08140 [Eikenella sp. NML97-A-109]QED92176.1 SH3 domain-containing protein [Eikenella exigua]
MKTFLAALLTAASLSAQAADYFLPHIEADGTANVRTAPNANSRILARLDYRSAQREILSRQGNWYHIRLDGRHIGFVHQNQGFIVQNYIVASPNGSANVHSIHPGYPTGRAPIIKTLSNGTRVQIVPGLSKDNWLLYDNQGAYTEKDEYGNDAVFQGYIHKSQLRRVN